MPSTGETGRGGVGHVPLEMGSMGWPHLCRGSQRGPDLFPPHSVLARDAPGWRQALGLLRRDWRRGVNYSPIVGTMDLIRKDSDDFSPSMRPLA